MSRCGKRKDTFNPENALALAEAAMFEQAVAQGEAGGGAPPL